MWDSVLPITKGHNPIIAEGALPIKCIVFNAGPANIEAQVWAEWGNHIAIDGSQIMKDEPDFRLELRPGNQRIISGSFFRAKLKPSDQSGNGSNGEFAAIGVKIIP